MADIEKKEQNTLNKISKVIDKLDKYTDELDSLNKDTEKKHTLKKWYVQHMASHEIKRLLHQIDKYDKYEDKELDALDQQFIDMGLDQDSITYIQTYIAD